MILPHMSDLTSKVHYVYFLGQNALKMGNTEKNVHFFCQQMFSLKVDNVIANDCMQEILKDMLNLDDNIVCKREIFFMCAVICSHVKFYSTRWFRCY